MKRSILTLLFATNGLFFVGSLANAKAAKSYRVAQNDSTGVVAAPAAPTTSSKVLSAKGFRVGLMTSALSVRARVDSKSSLIESGITDRLAIDRSLGFGLGYAYIPVGSIGVTVQFSYFNLAYKLEDGESDSLALYRLDGNATYAFTDYFHVKGGINTSNIVVRNSDSRFMPGGGLQAGVGFQINNNFGLDLMGTYMTQESNQDGVTITPMIYGPELSLHATF